MITPHYTDARIVRRPVYAPYYTPGYAQPTEEEIACVDRRIEADAAQYCDLVGQETTGSDCWPCGGGW